MRACGLARPHVRPLCRRPALRQIVRPLAKRAGPKKGKSLAEWVEGIVVAPFDSTPLRSVAEQVCAAFRRRTGGNLAGLVDGGVLNDLPKALWHNRKLAVAVVFQDEIRGPTLKYVNAAYAEALCSNSEALVGAPSPLPSKMLGKPYEGHYEKKVGAVTLCAGSRWVVESFAAAGAAGGGVAYSFPRWTLEDGTICEPGGVRREPAVDPADLEQQIEAQAAQVRDLKKSGLANDHALVAAAVVELLKLKSRRPAL
ncbi:hypothetical protein M885DRAFT_537504 [Pelagophyceae sp. CCMP2097]|nr:hypothetical protein M885DRAFT_537504 [Pelagophyceae sp. CCMP2097]